MVILNIKRELKNVGLCFLILSVMSIVRQFWLHAGGMQLSPAQATAVFFVYILLLNIWWNSILNRVAQKTVRRCLAASHWLIVAWFVVRLLQSGITAGAEQYGRFSGYLLAIPFVYSFLLNFYASLLLGKADDAKLSRRWYLLLIPATLIVIGFLTNDLHSFFHTELPVESGPSNLYGTNVGYILTCVWIIAMEIAKIVNIFRSGRRIENRLLRWLPIFELIVLILYSIPYVLTAFAPPSIEFIEYTAGLFSYEILVWETCILIGVLPVNTNYREIFHQSDIGMQIFHLDGSVFLQSNDADLINPQMFAQLKRDNVARLPNDCELHLSPIADGYAVWRSDTHELQRLTEELQEKKELLESEDILLRTELMSRRELQRIRERQRLYQMIYNQTESERKAILSIIPKLRSEIERSAAVSGAEPEIRKMLEQICDFALVIKNTGNRLLESEHGEEGCHEP